MQPNVREAVAAAVNAELQRKQMTQRMAAAILDLDQGSLQLRLVGKRAFRAEELAALAEALGVSVAVFYGEPATDTEVSA